MSYTIKLDGGKYTIINDNGILDFRRYDEHFIGATNLHHSGVVLAMAQRIEELEVAIKDVLEGTPLDEHGNRNDDGMADYTSGSLPLSQWQCQLRNALEPKP